MIFARSDMKLKRHTFSKMSLTLNVIIPHLEAQESFTISPGERVWDIKAKLIDKIGNPDNQLNFGLLMVEHKSNSGYFLDESTTFEIAGIITDVRSTVSILVDLIGIC